MASGLVAPIVDGELQTRTDSGDSLTKKSNNKNEIDSDMFLTLLVAEMQNQDPLEPTSNTEWVSQYATFTQVTKMSEMANTVDQLRGNSLVGKEVMMKVTRCGGPPAHSPWPAGDCSGRRAPAPRCPGRPRRSFWPPGPG